MDWMLKNARKLLESAKQTSDPEAKAAMMESAADLLGRAIPDEEPQEEEDD